MRTPDIDLIILAIALLIGILGKLVDFARKVRRQSIEAQKREDTQFGADLVEAREPAKEAPTRLALVRRQPRPRPEEPLAPAAPLLQPRGEAPAPRKHRDRGIVRLLRTPHGARTAVVLAEILGPPKALRRR